MTVECCTMYRFISDLRTSCDGDDPFCRNYRFRDVERIVNFVKEGLEPITNRIKEIMSPLLAEDAAESMNNLIKNAILDGTPLRHTNPSKSPKWCQNDPKKIQNASKMHQKPFQNGPSKL